MAEVSPFLRSNEGGYSYWCPGCGTIHSVTTMATHGPLWTFDGNLDAPTFNPSVRIFVLNPDDSERTLCHHWIKAGKIEFLHDCQHALAGVTVDLPQLPQAHRDNK